VLLNQKNAISNPLLWHFLGGVTFLLLPILLFPHPPEEKSFAFSPPTQRDLMGNIFMLLFFYINYYAIIPQLYFKKRYFAYALCTIVAFATVLFLPSLLLGHNPFAEPSAPPPTEFNHPTPRPENFTFMQEISHHIFLFTAVALFSVLLRIRDRLLQTEHARYMAELNSLKGQINPHFLFNTLNGIYALAVRDKSTTTATSILKLSGLMRYVVTETSNELVSLEKEIAYVNDYIELQKLRLDKRVQLSYKVIGNIEAQYIAPLTLIPFVENAFKHGVNPDEDSNINILIEVLNNEVKLTVENNKVNIALSLHEKSGKGIENTKSRLQLLYPSKHFLILSDDEKHFRVQLTIQLT
jgi:hypothetical protein